MGDLLSLQSIPDCMARIRYRLQFEIPSLGAMCAFTMHKQSAYKNTSSCMCIKLTDVTCDVSLTLCRQPLHNSRKHGVSTCWKRLKRFLHGTDSMAARERAPFTSS